MEEKLRQAFDRIEMPERCSRRIEAKLRSEQKRREPQKAGRGYTYMPKTSRWAVAGTVCSIVLLIAGLWLALPYLGQQESGTAAAASTAAATATAATAAVPTETLLEDGQTMRYTGESLELCYPASWERTLSTDETGASTLLLTSESGGTLQITRRDYDANDPDGAYAEAQAECTGNPHTKILEDACLYHIGGYNANKLDARTTSGGESSRTVRYFVNVDEADTYVIAYTADNTDEAAWDAWAEQAEQVLATVRFPDAVVEVSKALSLENDGEFYNNLLSLSYPTALYRTENSYPDSYTEQWEINFTDYAGHDAIRLALWAERTELTELPDFLEEEYLLQADAESASTGVSQATVSGYSAVRYTYIATDPNPTYDRELYYVYYELLTGDGLLWHIGYCYPSNRSDLPYGQVFQEIVDSVTLGDSGGYSAYARSPELEEAMVAVCKADYSFDYSCDYSVECSIAMDGDEISCTAVVRAFRQEDGTYAARWGIDTTVGEDGAITPEIDEDGIALQNAPLYIPNEQWDGLTETTGTLLNNTPLAYVKAMYEAGALPGNYYYFSEEKIDGRSVTLNLPQKFANYVNDLSEQEEYLLMGSLVRNVLRLDYDEVTVLVAGASWETAYTVYDHPLTEEDYPLDTLLGEE